MPAPGELHSNTGDSNPAASSLTTSTLSASSATSSINTTEFTTDEKMTFFEAVERGALDEVAGRLTEKPGLIGVMLPPRETREKYEAQEGYLRSTAYQENAMHVAARAESPEMMMLLLEYGAGINEPNGLGASPLHVAAKEGNIAAVNFLISRGADIDKKGRRDVTAMHYAAREGRIDVLKALIQAGADINAPDQNGNAPLHYAAMNGKPEAVKCLVQCGANVNIKNMEYESAQEWAFKLGKSDIGSYLQNVTPTRKEIEKFFKAIRLSKVDLVEQYLTLKPALNGQTYNGVTAISYAVYWNTSLEMVKYLSETSVNIGKVGVAGTLMHLAIVASNRNIARFLIGIASVRRNINYQDLLGNTLLHSAAARGDLAAVRMLIREGGADILIENDMGQTAKDLAESRKNSAVAEYLENEAPQDALLVASSSSSSISSSMGEARVYQVMDEAAVDEAIVQRLNDTLRKFAFKLDFMKQTTGIEAMKEALKDKRLTPRAKFNALILYATDRNKTSPSIWSSRSKSNAGLYKDIASLNKLEGNIHAQIDKLDMIIERMQEPNQAPTPRSK